MWLKHTPRLSDLHLVTAILCTRLNDQPLAVCHTSFSPSLMVCSINYTVSAIVWILKSDPDMTE